MLSVTASLKAQNRNVLDFLTQACRAARLQLPTPSLIPQSLDSGIPLFRDEKLLAAEYVSGTVTNPFCISLREE